MSSLNTILIASMSASSEIGLVMGAPATVNGCPFDHGAGRRRSHSSPSSSINHKHCATSSSHRDHMDFTDDSTLGTASAADCGAAASGR